MTGIEGIGEAVTGGLAARAVEPEAGEGRGQGEVCLNCGTALIGPHCHQCGQRGHIHRTIEAWWHDFLHSVLHLDGKLLRTLPLLAWRPCELTRRYVAGERARFISPIAIFLFSVFLMFAVFSFSGATMVGVGGAEEAFAELPVEAERTRRELAGLEAERRQAVAAGRDVAALDARIRELREDLRGQEAVSNIAEGRPVIDREVRTGWARLDAGIKKANENPDLLFYKLQNNAYKFSWALIPISVPFLWLLFLHRRRYRQEYKVYDHLVFVTYSIAFISLLFIAFVVLRSIGLGGGLLNLAFVLVPPLHMYRQLRGAYRLSRFSAIWRTFVLLNFASVALTLFFLILLALGVLA